MTYDYPASPDPQMPRPPVQFWAKSLHSSIPSISLMFKVSPTPIPLIIWDVHSLPLHLPSQHFMPSLPLPLVWVIEWASLSPLFTPHPNSASLPDGLMPDASFCTLTPNSISETEFWVKQKRIALLLCQAKQDTAGFCPRKLCVLTWVDLIKSFIAIVQEWACWRD